MSSRSKLREIINNPIILKKIINNLPLNIEGTRDLTNLSVWWILNKIDKQRLIHLIEQCEWINCYEIPPQIKRELKRIWIKIIRFIDSIWTHQKAYIENWEKNELASKMKIPWIALEYFLIDTITRLYKKRKIKVNAEKWPSELEWKKIDFILNYENIKLWIQLTLSEWSIVARKQKELSEKVYKIEADSWEQKEVLSISSKYIPDAPVLMIINSETSRQAHNNNILLTAFNKWQKNWFNTWWPTRYLWKDTQEELNKIWLSFPYVIDIALKFIKTIYNKWDINRYREKAINNLHLTYDWDKLKISFFDTEEKWNKDSKFMYSIEIFITSKLLKKIWVRRNLVELKNQKTLSNMKKRASFKK